MKEPLFSVLIANYNNGRFLQEAIDSVFMQTYKNWEIIIVDDKSTDNSFEIYDKYKNDNRFHIYFNAENKGCGYTKRRCAELANGEICGFLDPDDTLQKEALDIMVNEHVKNADVCLFYSKFYYVDKQMNVIGVSEQQCELPEGCSFLEFGRGISHFVSFKKAYYDQTEGINACYKRAVDHNLYYLLEEVGRTCFIDKPLYFYRDTGNNISTNENADAAFFWHLIAVSDACMRRGIDVEKVALKEYKERVKAEKEISFASGEASVRATKRYKVGRIVLSPFFKGKSYLNTRLEQ